MFVNNRCYIVLAVSLFAVLLSPGACAAMQPTTGEEAEEVAAHTATEIEEAEEEFKMIDTNADGMITKDEIMAMTVRIPGVWGELRALTTSVSRSPGSVCPLIRLLFIFNSKDGGRKG